MKIVESKYFLGGSMIFMALMFVVLVALQITYYAQTSVLLEDQFAGAARRAIYFTSNAIEEEEIAQIVREIAAGTTPEAERAKQLVEAEDGLSIQQIFLFKDSHKEGPASDIHTDLHTEKKSTGISATTSANASRLSENFAANRNLMFAVMARKYARLSPDRISKRVSHDFIRQTLKKNLHDNGIDLEFSFAIRNNTTGKIYNTKEKKFDVNSSRCYTYPIYSHDGKAGTYDMILYFPDKSPFIIQQLSLMVPYLLASIILLVICVSTIIYLSRQRQLAQIQNDFVRNMTHELKTPVASISLAAQMLSDPSIVKSETMTSRMCNTIKDESKRLVLLIDSVLQTSVLEQKGPIANPSPLDVHDIIMSARNSLLLKAGNKGGEIRFFPEADEFIISGDETHFTNIIFNLMDNAIKYASPDKKLLIEARTYNRDNRLFIEISDNGLGIDKQYLPYIFKKYYRVPTGDRHDIKGFGLGLAYVHNMVLRHNGHINVESQVHLGTRFIIDLPIYTD